ncbi:hypothetical protein DFAR_1920006 [Desulfarculales bacterium]
MGIFDLIEAFRRLLKHQTPQLDFSLPAAQISLEERMGQLLENLRRSQTITFGSVSGPRPARVGGNLSGHPGVNPPGAGAVFQQRPAEPQTVAADWGPMRIYCMPWTARSRRKSKRRERGHQAHPGGPDLRLRGPLSLAQMSQVLETEDKEAMSAALTELVTEYQGLERAFTLVEVAGGYTFRTRPESAFGCAGSDASRLPACPEPPWRLWPS